MKKNMLKILGVILTPFYTTAWVIAHILHLKDRDLMETPYEFATLAFEKEDE